MFTQSSMLIGCCRERHLTRIDPNVKDENVSWVWNLRSSPWTYWDSTPIKAEERLLARPSGAFFSVGKDSVLPMPFYGLGMASYDNGADPRPYFGYLTGPYKQSGRTSELYFRAILFNNGPTGENGVASMVGPDGKIIFKLTASGASQNGWIVTATWFTPTGETRTMRCFKASMPQKDWIDIKVFISATERSSMLVTPFSQPSYYHTVNDSVISGIRDNLGDRLHIFSDAGPYVTKSNQGLYIHRIGVGNKISTAKP